MSKVNPNASKLIDEYISSKETFEKELCELLRELIHKADTEVIEDWKWKIPIFNKKSMICGFAVFKNHISVSFFKGATMTDKHKLFTKDYTGTNMRTIKFTSSSEVNHNQLFDYFKEAFSQTETTVKKTTSKKEIEIPELLQKALNKNKIANRNFENMAYTYRKEYALHISQAKRESTKLKRLAKVISNLEQNIKMHEQYNC
jgi:hypothetical protein